MSTRIYVEESGTPIYARIAKALGAQLMGLGCEVLVIKPSGFNHASYLACVQALPETAVYVSNAGRNLIQTRLPDQPTHYFEHFKGRVVFLHQDSILSGVSFEQGMSTLQAWQRVAHRSLHLCIEPSSVDTLKKAGIANALLVPHASEIAACEPIESGFEQHCSFVGHAVPSAYRQSSGSTTVDALLQRLFLRRQVDLSTPAQPELEAFAEQSLTGFKQGADSALLRLAYLQWLRGQLMDHSLQFRGWVFEQAQIEALEIFGGDPGYLHGVERSLRVSRESIQYRPPLYERAALGRVFRGSRVSLNITSLQFDYAVINRFHDVFMAGGLCLTDRREGLPALTRHHAELSFSTLTEMEQKVWYFSDPAHCRERALLISAVQREIVENSGYPRLALEIRRFIHGGDSRTNASKLGQPAADQR